MTHVYAYVKEGCSKEQLKTLISGMKSAIGEGFNLEADASTVAIKELPEDCYSQDFGAFVLVYTAKGKGFDVKKRFVKLMDEAFHSVFDDMGVVRIVIKEQANDMVGLNGVLRYNAKAVNTAYEAS